jgi:hypothetical protein
MNCLVAFTIPSGWFVCLALQGVLLSPRRRKSTHDFKANANETPPGPFRPGGSLSGLSDLETLPHADAIVPFRRRTALDPGGTILRMNFDDNVSRQIHYGLFVLVDNTGHTACERKSPGLKRFDGFGVGLY